MKMWKKEFRNKKIYLLLAVLCAVGIVSAGFFLLDEGALTTAAGDGAMSTKDGGIASEDGGIASEDGSAAFDAA